MKRDRYASDYEQVRKDAGLGGINFEDLVAPKEVGARVEAAHDDFKERMGKLSAHDLEQTAKRKQEADALTARANDSLRRAEFAAAGVKPPEGMNVSLGLLLQAGWSIASLGGGQRVLLRPAAPPVPHVPPPTDADISTASLKEGF